LPVTVVDSATRVPPGATVTLPFTVAFPSGKDSRGTPRPRILQVRAALLILAQNARA
jgi:hypothetical protein